MAEEYDDDLELDEAVLLLGVVGIGAVLIAAAFFFELLEISSWGFTEWSSVAIIFAIAGGLFLAILLGSDEDGEQGGVFTSYGFALTVGFLIVGLIAIQTNLFGLVPDDSKLIDLDGDGSGDIATSQLPDGYVDYGEPQPNGFGNYGPPNDGLLTGGEGAGAGCIAGGGIGAGIAAWGAIPTGGLSIPFGAALGCVFGAGAGFFGSSADFDGDATTGW
tara:strand:- start:288 stop:941 length:654 start_codon:yes stop_codon:yes gene_type:complete